MALRAYTPERREINFKGKSLGDVRGLSLEDVSALLREHLPDLDGVAEIFRKDDVVEALLSGNNLAGVFVPLITQMPGFVANAIALAADEPKGAAGIMKWPLGVQAAAAATVWTLTFSEIGEIKKVLGIVTALRAQAKPMKTTKTTAKRAR